MKTPKNESALTAGIAKKLPYIIAFAINMGIAPLLFIQVIYGHFFYVSSVLMAVYWLSIIVLLLVAYYSAYIYDFKYEALGSARTLFIGVTVLILLFIAFLFTNNLTLMLHPETWKKYFENASGTILNLSDPTLIPRYLHFVTASVAVGGLFIALTARFNALKGKEERRAQTDTGMRWFCYATLAQMIIGLWFFMSLPSDIMTLFMGGNGFYSIVFLVGISGAVLSVILGFKRRLLPTVISLTGTVILMVLLRDFVRRAYLDPYFSLSSLKVIPQYSSLILFLSCFVIGLAVVGFILRSALKNGKGV